MRKEETFSRRWPQRCRIPLKTSCLSDFDAMELGRLFSPRNLLDIRERAMIDSALSRLTDRGQIRRVIRGTYDYSRFNELFVLERKYFLYDEHFPDENMTGWRQHYPEVDRLTV